MAVTESAFQASAVSGPADATGKCTARLGPLRANERWQINIIGITNTSVATNEPELRIYIGSEGASNLINGTYTGRRDSDPQANVLLETGEQMIAVWESGDVGSVGTLAVRGTRYNGVQ